MTDDRIRDIYKDDDPKELERLYCKVDAEVEKSKGRRVILLCVGFFVAYLILFWVIDQPDSFAAVAGTFLAALFLSPVHTWIHMLVFSQFIHKQHEENDRRELIQKRIQFAKERESRNTPYYQGYKSGYDAGYKKGENDGFTLGCDVGSFEDYDKGYKEGRNSGIRFGYHEGYYKGYDKGYHDAGIDFANGVYEDDYDGDDDDDSYLDSLLSDGNNT